MRIATGMLLFTLLVGLAAAGSARADERKPASLALQSPARTAASTCPTGSERDAACLEKAGSDAKAIAACPCQATKTAPAQIDSKFVRKAGLQPALPVKPAPVLQLQPAPAPTCGVGQAACGNVCRDLMTDPQNCGRCSNSCIDGYRCERGACMAPSPH